MFLGIDRCGGSSDTGEVPKNSTASQGYVHNTGSWCKPALGLPAEGSYMWKNEIQDPPNEQTGQTIRINPKQNQDTRKMV